MEHASWMQIKSDVLAVRVSPHLQPTIRGLQYALKKIPLEERRKYCGFSLAGAVDNENNERWFFIKVKVRP